MPQRTGGEAIVASLLANNIRILYGLPGVQLDGLFSALYDAGDAIRVIHTRHEQGAAYMALGHAAATGDVGAFAVVPGPGLLNTTAALSTAYATDARVLCVTGEIPSKHIGRGIGLLHEIPHQLEVLKGLTKWAHHIPRPAEVPNAMARAFAELRGGHPRPVAVSLAWDMMAKREDVPEAMLAETPANPPLDSDQINAAAKLLGNAKRPLIFVGGGAMNAVGQVAALAELLQAPVVAGRNGAGVLSSRHALHQHFTAGYKLWAKADVVLAVGTRLHAPLMDWGVDKDMAIIRVDIDAEEPSRITAPTHALVADAAEALDALLPEVEQHNIKRESRRDEMAQLRAENEAFLSPIAPQLAYMQAIREALPDNGIFVSELTQIGYASRLAMPAYQPRSLLNTGYQGTLGWGIPTALGVKTARPDAPVVAVTGDGGALYGITELATAVQHNIPVVFVLFNDGAFGNVRRMQKELYDNRLIATKLQNPDFVKLTESFGAMGLRANSPEELRGAIGQAFKANVPALIEVPVGEFPDPWNLSILPRVRGEAQPPSRG